MIIHGPDEWVEVNEEDTLRPEFRPNEVHQPGPPPRVENRCHDLFDMFEQESIGGTVHTSLSALIERWGVEGAFVIEELALAGATSVIDVKIRWSDGAVRITRLAIGPTWHLFGRDRA